MNSKYCTPINLLNSAAGLCLCLGSLLITTTLHSYGKDEKVSDSDAIQPSIAQDQEPDDLIIAPEEYEFEPVTEVHPAGKGVFVPELKDFLKNKDPFIRDSQIELLVRSAYFKQENEKEPLKESWALGGRLIYTSGYWKELLRIGLGYYTSNRLSGPDGQGGSKLLKPDQGNINVLGQAYVELKFDVHHIKAYRQGINTPFVNEYDSRIVPNLFEAYMVESAGWAPVNYIAGYITDMKTRDSSAFIPMSQVAKSSLSQERGLAMGGVSHNSEEMDISLWEYYAVDVFNTVYLEFDDELPLTEDLKAVFGVQFGDQRSVGEELVGDYDIQMVGVATGLKYEGFTAEFRFNYNTPASGFKFKSPFGRYLGYTKSIVENFNTPDTQIYGAWLSYDFGKIGAKGLKFKTNYTSAVRQATGSNAGPDLQEFDVTLDYKIKEGFFKGLWFRARGAWVSFDDTPGSYKEAINDYRFYINYEISLL